MYKFVFTAAISLCCSLLAHAQSQSSSSLDQGNYPLSVTLKVRDVLSNVTSLSDAQQTALAEVFTKEQQLFTGALDNQATEQLKTQLAAQFQGILTASQFGEYSAKRNGSYLLIKPQAGVAMKVH